MNGFNHDVFCEFCHDTGLVRGDYADEDGYEMEFCTRCVRGEERADEMFRAEQQDEPDCTWNWRAA